MTDNMPAISPKTDRETFLTGFVNRSQGWPASPYQFGAADARHPFNNLIAR